MVWGFISGFVFAAMVVWLTVYYYFRHNPTSQVGILGKILNLHLPERSNDILYYFDVYPKLRLRFTLPSLEDILGEEKGKLAYKEPRLLLSLLHPNDRDTYIGRFRGGEGFEDYHVCRMRIGEQDYAWYEDYLVPVRSKGRIVAIQGILRNVDKRMRMQEMLKYRVSHDSMTGVHSREYFEEMMKELDKDEPKPVALAICDMDELKRINDSLGHRMGDHYIRAAANMLKRFASDNVVISRIGGDEFSILMLEMTEEEGSELISRISLAALESEEVFPGVKMSMSVGYAYLEHPAGRMDDLFEQADSRMYKCKMSKRQSEQDKLGVTQEDLDTQPSLGIEPSLDIAQSPDKVQNMEIPQKADIAQEADSANKTGIKFGNFAEPQAAK